MKRKELRPLMVFLEHVPFNFLLCFSKNRNFPAHTRALQRLSFVSFVILRYLLLRSFLFVFFGFLILFVCRIVVRFASVVKWDLLCSTLYVGQWASSFWTFLYLVAMFARHVKLTDVALQWEACSYTAEQDVHVSHPEACYVVLVFCVPSVQWLLWWSQVLIFLLL